MDGWIETSVEEEILFNVSKKKFLDVIKNEKIDFDKVVEKKKNGNEHFHKFNYLIRKLRDDKDFSILNCAIFLFQDYFANIKDVLDCFDETNKYELRVELGKKHNIKMTTSILKKFLKKIER